MALIIDLNVVPSSGKQEIKLDKRGFIKCYLKSNPEQGKANAELVRMLANELKITQSQITLISGLTSRKKKIKIDLSITLDELLDMLGIHRQKTVFEQ